MSYSVGEIARSAGVSVRTLHHYDGIGLLSPGDRSAAGYRRYGDADVERLQRILCYRQLGFSLDEIAAILAEQGRGALDHLRRQHRLMRQRIEQLQQIVAVLETTMEARQMGIQLDPDEMLEVFGDFDPGEHAEEAEERWGDSDAWKESQRRTSSYTKQDWLRIKAEGEDINQRLAATMAAGAAADSNQAMDVAEAHRAHITRWFYDLPHDMQRGLGDLYVADPRFTATYEKVAPGAAQFFRDAIHANADRAARA